MKEHKTVVVLLMFALLFVSCNDRQIGEKQEERQESPDPVNVDSPTVSIVTPQVVSPDTTIHKSDSVAFVVSNNMEDAPSTDYLLKELEPIRKNFKRINSIDEWTSVIRKGDLGSPKGVLTIFHHSKRKLEKIIVKKAAGKFIQLSEFYLLKGKLSFVIEKTSWLDRRELDVDKSYFENGKLIHQVNNQDCGAPFSEDYLLEEQKRILTLFNDLLMENNEVHNDE
jgi:hypothetical protein